MTPSPKKHGVLRVLLFLLLLTPLTLLASIAKFSAIGGDVSIIENGKSSKATMSSVIDKSDKIVTGENGKAQIVFKDNTVITLGINSDFAIEEYFSDAKKPKASFSIGKGTFKALTGAMGKINPDGFKLKTKTATIGIRGTGILGKVTPQENQVACTKGAITVTSTTTGDTVEVPAGSITTVTPNTPPTPPRAYTPEETGAIESESGVNDMPSDTQTQEESGGVEGGEAGATEAAAEEGTTEETANTEQEDAGTEGEATATDEGTPTEADAIAGGEEALPEATDIEVADSLAVGGVDATDQMDSFLEDTAEALGVDVDTLTGELDGLTLDDLEGIEEIIPEGTEGAGGETYYYADDRDVYMYGILGSGEVGSLNVLNVDPSDTSSNSILLKGYEFTITQGAGDFVMNFAFPRTPVADTYVWYNSATIGTYDSSDATTLDAIFTGMPLPPGSTWISGSEIIFFDSKQEFFVYHAVGEYSEAQSLSGTMEKISVMGERSSWADKPSYMTTYNSVFDSDFKLNVNFYNTRVLGVNKQDGSLSIGSVSNHSGYMRISANDVDGWGQGYIFGSELQGFGVETGDISSPADDIDAGYEDISKRRAPSYMLGVTGVSLPGKSIIDDGGVTYTDLTLNINIGSGTIGATIDVNNEFGDSYSGAESAYLDDSTLGAVGTSNKVIFSTGSDSYTTWGYWGAPSQTFYEDKGYWIAGDTTGVADKITSLVSSNTIYSYSGWTEGHINDSGSITPATGSISFDINFNSTKTINNGLISLGSISKTFTGVNMPSGNGDFSHDDNIEGVHLRGQLYGSGLERAAGTFKVTEGTQYGIGIFNASKH